MRKNNWQRVRVTHAITTYTDKQELVRITIHETYGLPDEFGYLIAVGALHPTELDDPYETGHILSEFRTHSLSAALAVLEVLMS